MEGLIDKDSELQELLSKGHLSDAIDLVCTYRVDGELTTDEAVLGVRATFENLDSTTRYDQVLALLFWEEEEIRNHIEYIVIGGKLLRKVILMEFFQALEQVQDMT